MQTISTPWIQAQNLLWVRHYRNHPMDLLVVIVTEMVEETRLGSKKLHCLFDAFVGHYLFGN